MSSAEVVINHAESGSYMLDEYNVDGAQDDNCQNITCADATFSTIYLQDGQYFVSEDNQTIVLESSNEDVNQYVLNNEVNMMQLDVNDPQVLEDIGMVRYYDEESGQVYYCKIVKEGDSNYIAVDSENDGNVLADNEIVINSDHDLHENETTRLEQPQSAINGDAVDIVDQNFVELPSNNVELITSLNERSKYSYAILKDGKLHLRTIEPAFSEDQLKTEQDDSIAAQLEALQQSISFDNPEMACDLGSITGKNLITGQVVTLDSYLERLEKRRSTIHEELLRTPVKRQSSNHSTPNRDENSIKCKRTINKNTDLERLRNGRKLKGKIVKIEKKQTTELKKEQNTAYNSQRVYKKRNKGENENSNCSSMTSDTLTKLQTLLVLKDAKEKVSSTLVGLMELDSIRDQLKDKNIVIKLTEKTYDCSKNGYNKAIAYFYGRLIIKDEGKQWEFFLINNKTTEVNWMNNNVSNDSEFSNNSNICQQSTVCVHLLVTIDKNGKKTTCVNIEHVPLSHCPFCNKTIETSMEVHLSQVHVPETTIGFVCSQCELNFDSMTRLQKHLRIHSRNYRFECGTCSRKFTRHTNWQRHMDVHKSASEVAYHCDICGCGFNYASSLTRHIVQKHINKQ